MNIVEENISTPSNENSSVFEEENIDSLLEDEEDVHSFIPKYIEGDDACDSIYIEGDNTFESDYIEDEDILDSDYIEDEDILDSDYIEDEDILDSDYIETEKKPVSRHDLNSRIYAGIYQSNNKLFVFEGKNDFLLIGIFFLLIAFFLIGGFFFNAS